MQKELTKTLVFQLDIDEGDPLLLSEAFLESRRAFNETLRLDREGRDWGEIEDTVAKDANLVQNTAQQVVSKAQDALENYYDNDDWGMPWYHHDEFPLPMNYGEGYNLFLKDNGTVRFRISAKPYKQVKGELRGSPDQFNRLKTAMTDDGWRVGTAEAMQKNGRFELHVTVTYEQATVRSKTESDTVVGVDINEDCVALAAFTDDTIEDSVVIDFPEIKEERHRFFTMRKRMQKHGQTAFNDQYRDKEQRFVHDQLHKVSRLVVEWSQRFDRPVIVFEDLKGMRDDIEYGTRMNRRLHSLPFTKLRDFISYKSAWTGIPSDDVEPAYTSQRCPRTECRHTTRGNRHKKRFKCQLCGFQDHSDRKAAVCVVQEWFKKQHENVPALNTLPQVRKWELRRQASGPVDGPTVTQHTDRGHHADGVAGVSD
ncbi:RNA-guided endonuclease TnpB family protein [Halorientalis salina]|uniref:RNA-guided endonuclease TnpB family protein n=1 Tax=Halorientalis salina TaxID=2932266 RepID=UPI0010ACB06D|nr:RNA-guided endonuclease TnpB family protein [Halorientalis salina]